MNEVIPPTCKMSGSQPWLVARVALALACLLPAQSHAEATASEARQNESDSEPVITEGWNAYDSNGNVILLTDSAAAPTARYEYDAFGKTTAATGPAAEANRYRFSTKPVEPESGLAFYGYRYYSPEIGRWPSRDPIAETGGFNLYVMVRNNVLSQLDLLGLELWTHVSETHVIPSAFVSLTCPTDCEGEEQIKFKVVGYRLFLEGHNRSDARNEFKGCFGLRYDSDGEDRYEWWGCWTGVFLFNDAVVGGPLTAITNAATCGNLESIKAQLRAHIQHVADTYPPSNENSY